LVYLASIKIKKKKLLCRVWTADSEGNILVWKGETKFKKIVANNNSLTPLTSMCLALCNEGMNVWVGTKIGVILIYEVNNCSQIKYHKLPEELKIHYVSFINNQIWIMADKGPISIYDTDTLLSVLEINETIGGHCIIEVDKSHAWIADKTGCINILDLQSKLCIKKGRF